MRTLQHLNAEWRANQHKVDAFMDATCLVPVVVLDSVVDELASFFSEDPEVDRLYSALRSPDVAGYVEGRSALCFENNASFRAALTDSARDPRNVYVGFIRHWVAAAMCADFPSHYERLPAEFRTGSALPTAEV